MFIVVFLFTVIFLVVFLVSFFCLIKKKDIIEKIYIIIPTICLGFWAIFSLYHTEFSYIYGDFIVFYRAGKQVLINPSKLYDDDRFLYMPSFAVLFAISLSLIPFPLAVMIFLFLNYIMGIISLIEYDRILSLMNLKKKSHRFIFLMMISNGFFIYYQFVFNQSKYILFVIFLVIIRRELQFNNQNKLKDLKYYIINYSLFVFAIGMAPYFLFLLLIYIFHNIPREEIFKIDRVKSYIIVLLLFTAQNFLFIIYPSLILEFLDGINHPQNRNQKLKLLYLREWLDVSANVIFYLSIISNIILLIVTITLISKEKMQIEKKFGFFSIFYILIGVYAYSLLVSLILFSFVLLLYVPYVNQNLKGNDFINNKRCLIIGFLSISAIFLSPNNGLIFEFMPLLREFPFFILINLRYILLLLIMIISITKLYFVEDLNEINKILLDKNENTLKNSISD